jgi:hypothetical protein
LGPVDPFGFGPSLTRDPLLPPLSLQASRVVPRAAIEWYGPDRPKFLGECSQWRWGLGAKGGSKKKMIALEDLLPFTPPLQRFNRIPGAGTPLIGWIICLLSLIWGLMGSWAPAKAFARRSLCTHRSGAVLLRAAAVVLGQTQRPPPSSRRNLLIFTYVLTTHH